MHAFMQRWAKLITSSKGAKITLVIWLLAVVALSGIAPGAKEHAVNSGEGSIREDTPSAVAQALLQEQFPSEDGAPALLVFHGQQAITAEQRAKISEISEWLSSDQKPEHLANAIPFHQLPKSVQEQMFSKDGTTLILSAVLQKGIDSSQTYDTLKQIRERVEQAAIGSTQFEITGPAGISSDTTTLFKNADFVLMLATVVLILVILIVIYRSPLLAIIPLLIAGVVYQIVDRILGLAGLNNWFVVDKQALSIMMILLFAVLTDYCLFIFSRYREELKHTTSKYDAMKHAFTQVAEPILFSGGTVFIAMVTLFAAIFKPYHHFAPVFSIAMVVILLSGLTLIPAVFAIVGRKAFWPAIPKMESAIESTKPVRRDLWQRVGSFVTRQPGIMAVILIIPLLGFSLNALSMNFSFNLMKSFPSDVSSRQGFEILESRFPPGELAPVTVLLQADGDIVMDKPFVDQLGHLTERLKEQNGIESVSPAVKPEFADGTTSLPKGLVAQGKQSIKLQMILQSNPYEQPALDLIYSLRDQSEAILRDSGLNPANYKLHFAGQSAEQLDVQAMNKRDMMITFSLITLFIGIMLALQTRSIMTAVYMIATILLSYAATIGLGWAIFHEILGYDSISYRLPVYTFVFLVSLGVDYNIMLVSRIREEARKLPWKEAISRGVGLTGGVISSAGIILAATFSVLITQPLQELFLFGLTMALGILIDTFLVRGMLLPSILALVGNKKKSASVLVSGE